MTTQDDRELPEFREGAPSNAFRTPVAAATVGLILTLGLFLALGSGTANKRPVREKGITPSPAPSTSRTAPAIPSSPKPTTSPRLTIVAIRWHGTVTVIGSDSHKDLDEVPPRTSPRDSDLNGDWLKTTISADSPAVQIAVLSGDGTLPEYKSCRDSAYANGSDHTEEIKTGDVLCVVTSDNRIARLKTTRAEQTSLEPVVKFNVTVWDTTVDNNTNQLPVTPR